MREPCARKGTGVSVENPLGLESLAPFLISWISLGKGPGSDLAEDGAPASRCLQRGYPRVMLQETQEGLGHRLDGSPVPSSHLVLVFHPSTSHQETESFLSREMKPERIQVWGTRGRIAGGVGREQVRSETKGQALSANPPKGERSTPLASSPNSIKAGHPWNTAFLRTDILKDKVSRW